jgi:hypothetical protein
MSKQIILIIVEGVSDKNALEGIFKVVLQKENSIEFVVYDGDILQSLDPVKKIIQKCKETMSYNGFFAFDIRNIVQISDLDGCYIDELNIVKMETGCIKYNESTIACKDVSKIIARNNNKRTSIELLRTMNVITVDKIPIPFKLFYNSCNLEHVLYNEKNVKKCLKVTKAMSFALEYDSRESAFISFIRSHALFKEEVDLWEHVKIDNNSLHKSSTMYFLFDEV